MQPMEQKALSNSSLEELPPPPAPWSLHPPLERGVCPMHVNHINNNNYLTM
jgi:hypothetical protein